MLGFNLLREVVPPASAFLLVTGLLFWLLKSGFANKILDQPNARSLHNVPIPRIGGLAIMIGVLIAWTGSHYEYLVLIFVTTIALALISFFDDVKNLSAWQRLLVHLAMAIASVFIIEDSHFTLMPLLATLAIVWMTNLYNFMDGSDGLAGGMALFGFSAFALQSAAMGDAAFAGVNAVIAAANLGFLLFNFHPARVFMGDAGSIPLGFLAGLLGYVGWVNGIWLIWFPLLVFSPFIVDATLTLLKRLLHGEKIWQAHRQHYYQRLILLGHGHRKIAWLEYGLMFAVGVSALWGGVQPVLAQAILLGIWVTIYFLLALWIDRLWRAAGKQS